MCQFLTGSRVDYTDSKANQLLSNLRTFFSNMSPSLGFGLLFPRISHLLQALDSKSIKLKNALKGITQFVDDTLENRRTGLGSQPTVPNFIDSFIKKIQVHTGISKQGRQNWCVKALSLNWPFSRKPMIPQVTFSKLGDTCIFGKHWWISSKVVLIPQWSH